MRGSLPLAMLPQAQGEEWSPVSPSLYDLLGTAPLSLVSSWGIYGPSALWLYNVRTDLQVWSISFGSPASYLSYLRLLSFLFLSVVKDCSPAPCFANFLHPSSTYTDLLSTYPLLSPLKTMHSTNILELTIFLASSIFSLSLSLPAFFPSLASRSSCLLLQPL